MAPVKRSVGNPTTRRRKILELASQFDQHNWSDPFSKGRRRQAENSDALLAPTPLQTPWLTCFIDTIHLFFRSDPASIAVAPAAVAVGQRQPPGGRPG
ncbi:hypothetical protein FOCC_FOCC007000 [Frankliniella occidentalis]|nr:hypothetical protein FOCC_FOCC007000 [Frankliniella occidentalis]